MGGALWFLATLMEVSVAYCIITFVLNCIFKNNDQMFFLVQWIVSILFLCIGFICYKTEHSFWGINRVFLFFILFHGGYCLKKYGWSSKERVLAIHFGIFAISLGVLLVFDRIGSIALNRNSYVDPIFLLIVSFAGWQFLYEMVLFLQKFFLLKKYLFALDRTL